MQKFCKFLDQGIQYNNNNTDFTIAPCCYFGKTYLLDPNKDITSQYLEHRKKWSNEDFTDTCRVCIEHEKLGMESYRQASFKIVPDHSEKVSMITVAVNKECNLACPQCGSHSSSFWYRENKRHGIEEKQEIINYHVDNHKGKITEKFISLFDSEHFSNVNYVKFGGGEPLMTDTHIRIIEKLKNKSDIELQYTSNFSIMPSEEVVNLWKQFKVVKWMASIDGVGDRFALLRWPHTWNKLQSLTERAIKETPDNVVFGVEHTLNMLNAYYYDEMEDWFYNHFCKDAPQRRGVFNLHNVIGRLSLAEIPKELREKIANKFGEDHLITKTVQNEEIKDPKYSVQYLDLLDRQRSTTWRSVFAEVENHYA
jgi:MoaA/NifB/PqqE/SkfB family radical SAM enzyme